VFKAAQSPDGYLAEAHLKLRPVDLASDGLFVAGLALGAPSLDEALQQAEATAGRAARILWRDELTLSGVVSEVDPDRCAACLTCVRACPYAVPAYDPEQRAIAIEAAACRGCGVCTAVCPRQAIQLAHFRDEQLAAVLRSLHADEPAARAPGATDGGPNTCSCGLEDPASPQTACGCAAHS
jgi:heterodisulfide reductase subunit A